MEYNILGIKKFDSKKGKPVYMVNVAYEKDGIEGLEVASYFTTEEHYNKFAPLVGHKVDSKKEVAVFYDTKSIYTRKESK